MSLYYKDVLQLEVSKTSYPTEWAKDGERSAIIGQGLGGGLQEFQGGGGENLEGEREYLQSFGQSHSVTVAR